MPWKQSLARVNLPGMIKPGGFLISNAALAGAGLSKLADPLQTSLLVTDVPLFFDAMFSYARRR